MTSEFFDFSVNGSISTIMNTSRIYENLSCLLDSRGECVIDHDVVCVGDPLYCNLSREEYIDLLQEYIAPTIPEWILIFSHFLVFTMGLVS